MIVKKENGEPLKDWPTWRKKILAYGKLKAPNRPSINSLLAEYDATTASEEFHDGTSYTCIVMMIICKCVSLVPRPLPPQRKSLVSTVCTSQNYQKSS